MKNAIAIAIATATIGLAALPASAKDGDDWSKSGCGNVPRAQWMSVQEIDAKFTGMGYKVRKIEIDDGCYEIYALDSNGMRIEAYIHPATAAIVAKKYDD